MMMSRALSRTLSGVLLATSLLACAGKPAPQPPKAQGSPLVDHASTAAKPAPRLSLAEYAPLFDAAMEAYQRQDWATCAERFQRIAPVAPWRNGLRDRNGAASCLARAGKLDAAIAELDLAVIAGWRDVASLTGDADLAPLQGHARWPAIIAAATANYDRWRTSINAELVAIHEADQADRRPGPRGIDWSVVSPRDLAREARVRELIAADALKVADDYFHAAMVMQHGQEVEDFALARDLAERAVALDPDHASARWLSAAAEDRRLMNLNLPQKYATQYRRVDGKMTLYQVDPSITDEQRAERNCPSLAVAQRQAAAMDKR